MWSNSVEPAGHTTAGIADWWHTAAAVVAAAAAVVVVVAASSPAVPSSAAGRPVVVQQFGHSSIAATQPSCQTLHSISNSLDLRSSIY